MDNNHNDIKLSELEKIKNYFSKLDKQNNLNNGILNLNYLMEEFKKFGGDYINLCDNFFEMSEEDQKLFVLYSLFRFDLKFHREDYKYIVTDELLKETDKLTIDFERYGSNIGCDLNFSSNISLRGVGYNLSSPLKTNNCIKPLSELDLSLLAFFTTKGYEYSDEEEHMFQLMNDKRVNEIQVFNDLMGQLISNRKIQ